MRRFWWAALCAAGVMVGASQANATVVLETFTGETRGTDLAGNFGPVGGQFGDVEVYNPLSPPGDYQASFIFDTSRGTLATFANHQSLTWNVADGGLSPLLSGSLTLTGTTVPGAPFHTVTFDFTGAVSFDAEVYLTGIWLDVNDGARHVWFVDTGSTPFSLGSGYFDQPVANTSYSAALNNGLDISGVYSGGLNVEAGNAVLTPQSAAPEPTSWALLILGFAGVGAMLRRQNGCVSAAT